MQVTPKVSYKGSFKMDYEPKRGQQAVVSYYENVCLLFRS